MGVYVSFLTENALYKDALANASKDDVIFLFHTKQDDKIPMSVTKDLCSATCKVEFIEIQNEKMAERELAFRLGILTERYKDVSILSKNPVLAYFSKKTDDVKTEKVKKTKDATSKKEPATVPTKEPVAVEEKPAVRKGRPKKNAEDAPTATKKPRETKETSATSKDDTDDDAYLKGMEKLKEIIAKAGFNPPNDYIFCVTKAVRDIDVRKEPFSKTILLHCPEPTAVKLGKALQKKETEMKAIVATMVDESYE